MDKTPNAFSERFDKFVKQATEVGQTILKDAKQSDVADLLKLGYKPLVDVTVEGGAKVYRMDLPGVKKTELDLTTDDGVLTISGKREKTSQGDGHFERVFGEFSRQFRLPGSAKTDQVTADFEDGVLTVRVPFDSSAPEGGPRKVTIK